MVFLNVLLRAAKNIVTRVAIKKRNRKRERMQKTREVCELDRQFPGGCAPFDFIRSPGRTFSHTHSEGSHRIPIGWPRGSIRKERLPIPRHSNRAPNSSRCVFAVLAEIPVCRSRRIIPTAVGYNETTSCSIPRVRLFLYICRERSLTFLLASSVLRVSRRTGGIAQRAIAHYGLAWEHR